jgi:hypothetical protein
MALYDDIAHVMLAMMTCPVIVMFMQHGLLPIFTMKNCILQIELVPFENSDVLIAKKLQYQLDLRAIRYFIAQIIGSTRHSSCFECRVACDVNS